MFDRIFQSRAAQKFLGNRNREFEEEKMLQESIVCRNLLEKIFICKERKKKLQKTLIRNAFEEEFVTNIYIFYLL